MGALIAMPDHFKVDNQTQKLFLRQSFTDLYPEYLLNNPKLGLTVDLREYFLDDSVNQVLAKLIDESEFGRRFVNRKACAQLVHSTFEGRRNYGWQIWSLYLCSQSYERMRHGNGSKTV